MNAYIDISYIFHLLTLLNIPYYCNRFFHMTMKKSELVALHVFSVILYFNVFLFSDLKYINYAFLLVFFFFVYTKEALQYFLLYLFVYMGNVSTVLLFTNEVYLRHGLVFLNNPKGFLFIFAELINILIIELIMLSIKKIKLLKNYYAEVSIKIDDRYRRVMGYIDSGNTLLIEGIPVVFLKEEYFKKKHYDEMIVNGIGTSKSKYFKTKIVVDGQEKQVICASGSNKGYKGCDCLINIYLYREENNEIIK